MNEIETEKYAIGTVEYYEERTGEEGTLDLVSERVRSLFHHRWSATSKANPQSKRHRMQGVETVLTELLRENDFVDRQKQEEQELLVGVEVTDMCGKDKNIRQQQLAELYVFSVKFGRQGGYYLTPQESPRAGDLWMIFRWSVYADKINLNLR